MTTAAQPRLLLLAPTRLEARAVSGAAGDPATVVARTGIGPKRAAAAAPFLRAHVPAAVAVTGVAGGLVPGLEPGTLVVADRVLDERGAEVARIPAAPLIAGALRRLGAGAPPVRIGAVVTTPRVVRGRAAREALAALGALAVDMETAALLRDPWECPTAVVRAVADTPDHELLSPAALGHGRRALASLGVAVPALEEWAALAGSRRVILAGPRSFCAGVERAIRTVDQAIERFGAPVYVRRQIVHNRHVVADLEARGAVFVHELDEVPDGATVVFSAHGVAPAVRAVARDRDLQVVDATCPLVAKVHHEINRFVQRGYQVVLIGHAGHDEIEGTLGEAEGIQLVEDRVDVDALSVENPDKLAYVTQTTLSPSDVATLVGELTQRFPAIVGPHAADVCYATQNRQDAVRAIARDCDVLLVIGSANSSNTMRLVEVAGQEGCRAVMFDDELELRLEWLRGATAIGVTAGASAPPVLVEKIVDALAGLGPLEIEERSVRTENVNFPLPVEVR
jgi:4-hydroxy-3-methylbut-2-enyl diphosphate reductase